MARTIVIGDVHGCRPELEELLDRLALARDDALCFVGDLVARGPDSPGVLDLVAQLGAALVVGNHEWRLLAARRGEPVRLGPSHRALIDSLDDRHWATIEAMRAWVDVPSHPLRVVHAGVVPGVAIDAQDPWALSHLRTLRDDGTPSDKRDFTLWGARYREAPHVVFGHNAVDGLQLHPCATGIDTGCVYGGQLTALVLAAGEPVPPPSERGDVLVSVRARRAYVELRPGA
ncbi:MAG: metallophosphoesterase [Polyangiaceae bacterium]|nr:metallophosphoesterase [Polyangiaceae bacterium]